MAAKKRTSKRTSRKRTSGGNPDKLTAEQQAAKDAGQGAPPEEPAAEPKKGELTDTVLHRGREFPAGTKVADLPDLSKESRERLERLELIK